MTDPTQKNQDKPKSSEEHTQGQNGVTGVATKPSPYEHYWMPAGNERENRGRREWQRDKGNGRRRAVIGVIAVMTAVGALARRTDLLSFQPAGPAAPYKFDYRPHMAQVQHEIRQRWHPENSASHELISVHFTIHKNGEISNAGLDRVSNVSEADFVALKSVIESMPKLPPLPADAPDSVDVMFGVTPGLPPAAKPGVPSSAAKPGVAPAVKPGVPPAASH
jgi:hypothetical protein